MVRMICVACRAAAQVGPVQVARWAPYIDASMSLTACMPSKLHLFFHDAVRQVCRANLVMSHSRKAMLLDQMRKDTVPQSALQAIICTSDPRMLGLCRRCSSSALRLQVQGDL